MDIKQIKEVIDLMKKAELSNFEIEDKGFKLRLQRETGSNGAVQLVQHAAPAPVAQTAAPAAPAVAAPAAPAADAANIKVITSPMVGTFYASSSPDAAPFVGIGSNVKLESVVCIVEAMKVMNEVQSEVAGTIVEVLLSNGTSVEYGQPLFKIKVA
jgi:acetyl-CoA carboxylase biotin carboxyl carrier protein